MIDRKFFFDQVRSRLFGGKLTQGQVDGLTALLDGWEAYFASYDTWLAYALATAHHETARMMQPIEEYGKGQGREYGKPDPVTGQTYYGRGFVQLTWKFNYERMSVVVGKDLVHTPALALDMQISTRILYYGMIYGVFTGKKLHNYFNDQKEDWLNARRIINGLDKAELIADYGKQYFAAIRHLS
jgi:predicted chitinase